MNRFSSIKSYFTRQNGNIFFSICCFAFPPILGSAVSFVFIGGGLWSFLEVVTKKIRFNADRPMLALTIAIYLYCAAYILASAVNGSLASDASSLLKLVPFLLFPFSYSVWSITEKTTLARIAMVGSMVACFGALVLAFVQYYRLGMRAEGGAGNAIVFATVTCLAALVCLAGALTEDIRAPRVWLLCGAAAGAVAVIYSGSRIIWVAMLIACILVLWVNRQRLKVRISMRLLAVASAIAAVAIVLGFHLISGRLMALQNDLSLLETQGRYDTATGFRIALWRIGIDAFKDAPLFGHGLGPTKDLIRQGFQDQFGMKKGFGHFHNGFLTALVQAGILGALALASIFVVAAKNAATVVRISGSPVERFGATMVLVAVTVYLVGGMTGILVGHDILDSVLMIFLVAGTYLASGSTTVPDRYPASAGMGAGASGL